MTETSIQPRITSLPGQLINQIAAGEVIERPASVVKELVENAIDSGATRIEIEIAGGGTDKIIVRDNGCGIHPEDLELAILRHSTSKLQSRNDLDSIRSLGFRGEALSSIAAVSDFSITSRIPSEDYAKRLVFNPYSVTSKVSPAARDTGTTVEVYKLFQPVPARRKFLRSTKTEFLHIQEIVKRFVLSRFDIDFNMYHNGKSILICPASEADCRTRLSSVLGKAFYGNAWEVDSRVDDMRLRGWLGGTKTGRSQSDQQYLFLNNRIIRDKHINHAIRKVLDGIVPEGRYPSYVLHLFIDFSSVDVNVHPTKQEVRFKNPRNVHDFIYAALHDVINTDMAGRIPARSTAGEAGKVRYDKGTTGSRRMDLNDLGAFYSDPRFDRENKRGSSPLGIPVTILYNRFLITRQEDEYRVIDIKRLKRYALTAALEKGFSEAAIIQRPLMVPVTLTLAEQHVDFIMAHQNLLQRLGMEILQSGPQNLTVRSIPSLLPDLDIAGFFNRFVMRKKVSKTPVDGDVSEILSVLVEFSGSENRLSASLDEIYPELLSLDNLDLPFSEKKHPSFWNTLSESELVDLVNDGD